MYLLIFEDIPKSGLREARFFCRKLHFKNRVQIDDPALIPLGQGVRQMVDALVARADEGRGRLR